MLQFDSFFLENETKQWTDLVKATQIKEDAGKMAQRMALGGSRCGVVGALASPFEHCCENELIGSVNHGSYGDREWLKGELKAMEECLCKKLSVGSLPNVKPQSNKTKEGNAGNARILAITYQIVQIFHVTDVEKCDT